MDRGGFDRDAGYVSKRRARRIYGVELWDDYNTWEVRRPAGQSPGDLGAPEERRQRPQVAAEGIRLVVAGPGAGVWEPRPNPRRSGIYLCSPELVKPIVVCAVDLLVKPVETIPHLGLEWVWGLDRRGLHALEQQPSLAEAVAGISATVREASAEVIAGAAELAGMSSLGALVIGEVGGAVATIMVAPLVIPLELGVELINVVSMLLPAGDVRAWASLDFAKSWTEKTVIHGLDHYLEPWSELVSLVAGVWLSSLVVTSRPSRLETRPLVDTGLDDIDEDFGGLPSTTEELDDLPRKRHAVGDQQPQQGVRSLVSKPGPATLPRGSTGSDVNMGWIDKDRYGGSGASRASWEVAPPTGMGHAEQRGPSYAPAADGDQDIIVDRTTVVGGTPYWQDAVISAPLPEVVGRTPKPAGEAVFDVWSAGTDPADPPGANRAEPPRDIL